MRVGFLRDMPTASLRPVGGASRGSNEEDPEAKFREASVNALINLLDVVRGSLSWIIALDNSFFHHRSCQQLGTKRGN